MWPARWSFVFSFQVSLLWVTVLNISFLMPDTLLLNAKKDLEVLLFILAQGCNVFKHKFHCSQSVSQSNIHFVFFWSLTLLCKKRGKKYNSQCLNWSRRYIFFLFFISRRLLCHVLWLLHFSAFCVLSYTHVIVTLTVILEQTGINIPSYKNSF